MKKGVLYLAYDQGLEHGPTEFNDENVNPVKIIEIAQKGKYDAVIFQKGIAERYLGEIKKAKVPLIVKLNGKTNLYKGEPMSEQICTVNEAIKLGAIAVGYTIYLGSEFESEMLKQFSRIEEEAHSKGLQVIAWIYPRGRAIASEKEDELMAYSARVGLEIGADMVKLKYSGNPVALKWAVKAAGKCKIVVAGGAKIEEKEFLQQAKDIMKAGVAGIAVGRNAWKSENPVGISNKLRKIVKGN